MTMNANQRKVALWAAIIFCGMIVFPPLLRTPGSYDPYYGFLFSVEMKQIDAGKLVLQLLLVGVGYFGLNKFLSGSRTDH